MRDPGSSPLMVTGPSPLAVGRGMLDRSFWKDRKVFLTGHTGFKGSWLSLWLDMLGAQVTGYALEPPTSPNLFEQAGVAGGMRSVLADIRDFERLKSRTCGSAGPKWCSTWPRSLSCSAATTLPWRPIP